MKLILQSTSGEDLPAYADVVGHTASDAAPKPIIATCLNTGTCEIRVVSPSQDKGN